MDKEKRRKETGCAGDLRRERKMADIDGLLLGALHHEAGHPRRSGHILKVAALAGTIGREEGLEEEEQMILEAAAVLHDIGIKSCKEKIRRGRSGEIEIRIRSSGQTDAGRQRISKSLGG